jgi:heterodisulfide reductase subunit B
MPADAWQQKLEASTGRRFQMPILHLSQLIGGAALAQSGYGLAIDASSTKIVATPGRSRSE